MTEIQEGLLIAGMGMGFVFLLMILLWGVLSLMNRLLHRVSGSAGSDTEPETPEAAVLDLPGRQEAETQRRVLAAAVAVEMALELEERSLSKARGLTDHKSLSPWQLTHRSRQWDEKTR
ncbi:MAG: OadG family protein [Anaerolineales bacterium]|nr:OadG family protein [Anaerolineales bacterium]